MVSGNDAKANLGILLEGKDWFIVKRNPHDSEKKDEWMAQVKECRKDIRKPRDGKVVYIGSSWKNVEYTTSGDVVQAICMRIVYEAIEQTIDKHGQILMAPDIEAIHGGQTSARRMTSSLPHTTFTVRVSSITARSGSTWT